MSDQPATPHPGSRELVLTDEQAAVLADWLAALGRFVLIGSIHPRPYRPGLQGREIG